MANQNIGIMNFRLLLQLKQSGLSNRRCAEQIGIHRNTVNQYVSSIQSSGKDYASLLGLSDEALSCFFKEESAEKQARYQELFKLFPFYQKELSKPGCTRQTLWESYQSSHIDAYSYSQFNAYFRAWQESVKVSGKLIHKAAEKLYVDYTGKRMEMVDAQTGEVIEVEVFVGILPCSGMVFAQASLSQQKEDFLESMSDCLEYFGGVPQVITPDNLKSAVHKSSKYEPILNKSFKDFSLHYNCSLNPTRSYAPQDKALVESAVKLVYQQIFYPLSASQFFSLSSLNEQIALRLEVLNNRPMQRSGESRRARFEEIEKPYLKALPGERYQIKHFRRLKVQKMGYIYLSDSKNYYSVPYRYIGRRVQVEYTQKTVEIYLNGERLAFHRRSHRAGIYVTEKQHLSSTHRFYQDWSPEYFYKWALTQVGAPTADYIRLLIASKAYPEIGYKQALGIIQLHKQYGKQRLNKACQRAMKAPYYSYRTIKEILENKIEDLVNKQQSKDYIPEHTNIRGADYYQ